MTDPVEHLARLAGIDLDPGERDRIAHQLNQLQTLIDALPVEVPDAGNPQRVDLPLREDEPRAPLEPDVVAALMSRVSGAWLDLPPVREDES